MDSVSFYLENFLTRNCAINRTQSYRNKHDYACSELEIGMFIGIKSGYQLSKKSTLIEKNKKKDFSIGVKDQNIGTCA